MKAKTCERNLILYFSDTNGFSFANIIIIKILLTIRKLQTEGNLSRSYSTDNMFSKFPSPLEAEYFATDNKNATGISVKLCVHFTK